MNQFFTKLLAYIKSPLFLKRLLSHIPTPVPTGMTAFSAFVADIVALVGPIATPQDIEWVIDAEMMRIPPKQSRIAKNDFVKLVRVAAAKQLAGARFQQMKEAHDAALKAAQAATPPVEATTPPQVVANEPQKN